MTSTSDEAGHAQRVRRYYDNNATTFERLGQGGTSIHRAVWGPGVSSRADAMHYVDELLLDIVSRLPPDELDGVPDGPRPTVVDLGCGLGASLLYLADRVDMLGEGHHDQPAAGGPGDRAARGGRRR